MINIQKTLLCVSVLTTLALGIGQSAPLKVLVINQSGAFVHTTAINWLSNYITNTVGPQQGWTIVVPANAAATQAKFRTDTLATYNIIVFNNNTSIGGVITDATQRLAFQGWLRHGGGMVGWDYLMDHADLWPFMTDSVFSSTKYTDHSPWNSTAGKTARVRWDTTHTNGEAAVRANKPEYAALKTGFDSALVKQGSTDGAIVYPDEWYSYRINPRLTGASSVWGGYSRSVDVLLTIDENTYDVPPAVKMGADHPVAWAYTLPPDGGGKKGRFIFFGRGHDVGAYDGKSAGAAPNGIDSAATGPTKNWIVESIRWAAGLTQTPTAISMIKSNEQGILNAHKEKEILKVSVSGIGRHVVELVDLSGHKIGRQSGAGNREYDFANLKHSTVYVLRVTVGKKNYSKRVLF